jgi:hypothetical protein
MADSKPEHIKRWLVSLAKLVNAPGNPEHVATSLAVYIPLLLRTVPIDAFTAESLQAIARQCPDWMPSYGRLSDMLETWWDEHRPDRTPRLRGPEPAIYRVEIPQRRPPPDETEVAYVGELVAAFVHDVREDAKTREAAEPPRARPLHTGRRLTDTELLAAWERVGSTGVLRATALRRKLGLETAASALPEREQHGWADVLADRATDLASDEEEIPD